MYWNFARFKYKHMFMSGHFRVLSIWKSHFQCNANWKVPTTSAPIARSFCEGCTWHHLHILVKAPLCCDCKGRAASAQSFPQLHQAKMKIPRRDHFISACLRHTGVVHHAHPVRGESHIQHNAERQQHLKKVGLDFLKWLRVKETSEIQSQ